ncbi:hypothetical protein E3O67_15455 [Cryobacterium sp. TMT3-29-2]|nr:hypothetical protein E3O67_15455 [Cryobacterium sp. TMT3-29-2]
MPEVEEVRTPPSMEPQPTASTTNPDIKLPTAESVDSDEKKAVTFGLRTSLKKRAETAVLRTAGYEGGYNSMAALVDGALERELARLAIEFNNGEPFPRNLGGFRQGRPLGS